ncbi:serine protease family S54 putative [Chlorella virus XW01]|nr:serine protease family S54 putative [Chlorella virus XW01]
MITETLIFLMTFLHFVSNPITVELSRYKYLSPMLIYDNNQRLDINNWSRVIISNYFHIDSIHLFLNMIVFYKIGRMIESKLKPLNYASLIINLSILVGLLILMIRIILFGITNERYLWTHNVLGFSGVLYSLTYIYLYSIMEDHKMVLKNIIYELIINTILFPHASFIAHISGILIGYSFTVLS